MNGWLVQFSGHGEGGDAVWNILRVENGTAKWRGQVLGEELARRIADLLQRHGTEDVDISVLKEIEP